MGTQIPYFGGEKIDEWILKIEERLEFYNFQTEGAKVLYASFFLIDSAQQWWCDWRVKKREHYTLKEFFEAIYERFETNSTSSNTQVGENKGALINQNREDPAIADEYERGRTQNLLKALVAGDQDSPGNQEISKKGEGDFRVQEWWKEEDEHRESNHPLTATLFEEENEQTNPLEKTSTAAPEPKKPFQNQILELFFFQFIEWARNTGYLDFCFLLSQSLNSIDYRKIFIWDPGGNGGGGGGSNGGNGGGCCDTSLKSSCKWRLDNQHHSYNKFFSSGFVFFFGCFVLFGSIATVYGWFAFSPSVSTVLSTFGCQEDNEGSWSVGI